MKTLLIIIALAAACSTATYAQSAASIETVTITAPAKANTKLFSRLSIAHYENYANLKFTIAKVQNVRNYIIEAGNDTNNLETIAQINQPLNSTIPVKFSYVLQNQLNNYKYYRIVQISMAQEMEYSTVVEQNTNEPALLAGK